MLQRIPAGAALAAVLAVCPATADAQQTRAEILEQQRQEKASSLQPYKPAKLEKWMLWYEETDPIGRLDPHNGFYARYGYDFKPVGSGIGFGGGYRHDLFDRVARIDVGGGITFRNYQMLKADFSFPYLADERLELGGRAVYNHNPQEDFWGLGMPSLEDNRVSYRTDFLDLQGRAVARRLECDHLRVRTALALVPALADDVVSCDDDRTDDGIRPSRAAPEFGELDRALQMLDAFRVTTSRRTEADSFAVASALGFVSHASSWTSRRYVRT